MTAQLIELGKVAAAIVALCGLVVLIGKATRSMIRTARKLTRLADEVLGDDERPGWGKRLAALEAKVATVLAEVRPNGGASIKDQITRIEQATGAERPADS